MRYLGFVMLATLLVLSISPIALAAPYGSDYTVMPNMVKDMVVIGNSDGDYGGTNNVDYEFYNPTDSMWHVYRQADGQTWQQITDNYQNQGTTGTPVAGGPWYPQSVEFDNAGGISHNPNGNLLVANFGNSYTGFELYTINTNGSGDSWSSVWSSHCEAGGDYGVNGGPTYDDSLSERMGGVSFSPFNDKMAVISYDTGALWVLDYYDGGTAAGTGVAQWGQDPVVNQGVWAGNPRQSTVLYGGQVGKTAASQGTTWLNNNTVAVFNAFGEIVTADVSQIAGGLNQAETTTGDRTDQSQPNMAPTDIDNWVIAASVTSTSSQYTDIEYNPAIDPNHIYCAETKNSGYDGWLYRVEYDPATGAFGAVESWDLPDVTNATEPREIAFDSEGNLWVSSYRNPPPGSVAGDHCLVITDVESNFGVDGAVSVMLVGDNFGNYCGMDVASGMDILFDINGDGSVNSDDLNLVLSNYYTDTHQDATTGYVVDLNNDGSVNSDDLNLLLSDYYKSYTTGDAMGMPAGMSMGASAVPEPSSILMLVAGALGVGIGFFVKRRNIVRNV